VNKPFFRTGAAYGDVLMWPLLMAESILSWREEGPGPACVCIYLHVCVHVCGIRVYTCACVLMYTCMCTCVCTYVWYTCMCVCVCVCLPVCLCVWCWLSNSSRYTSALPLSYILTPEICVSKRFSDNDDSVGSYFKPELSKTQSISSC
jgi:hypothetical protein